MDKEGSTDEREGNIFRNKPGELVEEVLNTLFCSMYQEEEDSST